MGWLSLFPSISEMPPEVAEMFLYIFRNDTRPQGVDLASEEDLAKRLAEMMKRLSPES